MLYFGEAAAAPRGYVERRVRRRRASRVVEEGRRQPPWLAYEMDDWMDWVEAREGESAVRRLMDIYLSIIDEMEGGQPVPPEDRSYYYDSATSFEAHLKEQWEGANGPWPDGGPRTTDDR
jgi:hypothetical protein